MLGLAAALTARPSFGAGQAQRRISTFIQAVMEASIAGELPAEVLERIFSVGPEPGEPQQSWERILGDRDRVSSGHPEPLRTTAVGCPPPPRRATAKRVRTWIRQRNGLHIAPFCRFPPSAGALSAGVQALAACAGPAPLAAVAHVAVDRGARCGAARGTVDAAHPAGRTVA